MISRSVQIFFCLVALVSVSFHGCDDDDEKKNKTTDDGTTPIDDEEEEVETPAQQPAKPLPAAAPAVENPVKPHTPVHWIKHCWDKLESVSGSGEEEFQLANVATLIRRMTDKPEKSVYMCEKTVPKIAEKEFAVFGSFPFDNKGSTAVNFVKKVLQPFAPRLRNKIWVINEVKGNSAQFTHGNSDITFKEVVTHDQASNGGATPEILQENTGVDHEFRRFTVTSESVADASAMIKFCVDNIVKNPKLLTKQKYTVLYDRKKNHKFALITKGDFKMIFDFTPAAAHARGPRARGPRARGPRAGQQADALGGQQADALGGQQADESHGGQQADDSHGGQQADDSHGGQQAGGVRAGLEAGSGAGQDADALAGGADAPPRAAGHAAADPQNLLIEAVSKWIGGKQLSFGDKFYSTNQNLDTIFADQKKFSKNKNFRKNDKGTSKIAITRAKKDDNSDEDPEQVTLVGGGQLQFIHYEVAAGKN